MNIHELKGRSSQAASLRSNQTGRATEKATTSEATASAPIAEDRVDLSAQAATQSGRSSELQVAHKALLGIPPLSQERVNEILERLQNRYYEQPEVAREIAQRMATNLRAEGSEG